MSTYTPYILPASATVLGISATISGISEIAEKGKLQSGAKNCLAGLTSTNIGSRLLNVDETTQAQLMHGSLMAGAGAVAFSGVEKFLQGIERRDLSTILRGTIQAALGTLSVSYLNTLDSKIIRVAHQASVLSLASSRMIFVGAKDVIDGSYKKGLFKLIAGASGVAASGYYVYCTFSDQFIKVDEIPEQLDLFLKQHDAEINEMYQTHQPSGNWSKLGFGVSKNVYEHPDSSYIIKIPFRYHVWGHDTQKTDLEMHYDNIHHANQIIQTHHLDRVVVPEIYLIQTQSGPIVAEQKFEFASYSMIPEGEAKKVAEAQFDQLVDKGSFCDVYIEVDHNACFLKENNSTPKIAMFDFDCREDIENKIWLRAALIGIAAKTTQVLFGPVTANCLNSAGIAVGAAGLAWGVSYAMEAGPLVDAALNQGGITAAGTVTALGIGALAFYGCYKLARNYFSPEP